MKKMLIITALLISNFALFTTAHAQVQVNININSQPEWGPTGYDYVEYYYLPDMDVYYNVPKHQFYYQSGSKWIYSSTLPARYKSFDLYKAHKVVIKDKNVFQQHQMHKQEYARFKNSNDQQSIRDSKETRYSQSKNNWQNNQYNDKSRQQPKKPQANTRQADRNDRQHGR